MACIKNIGCFPSCEGITFPYEALETGTHTIVFDWLGVRKAITVEGVQGEKLTIPNFFNESSDPVFSVLQPSGEYLCWDSVNEELANCPDDCGTDCEFYKKFRAEIIDTGGTESACERDEGLSDQVFNIDGDQVIDNGDGTYTISVLNPTKGAMAFDNDGNVYEFDGHVWTLKSSPYKYINNVFHVNADTELTLDHNKGHIVADSDNDVKITISPNLPIGFSTTIENNNADCLHLDESVTIPYGYIHRVKTDGVAKVVKTGASDWTAHGDLMEVPIDNKYDDQVVLSVDQVATDSISWLQIYKSSDWPEFGISSQYFCLWSTDHASPNDGEIRWGSCSSPLLHDFTDEGSIIKGYQAETPWLLRVPSNESGINDEIFLYYHTASSDPQNAGIQRTRLMTTSGGTDPSNSNWTDRGTPIPKLPGDQHLGYAKVHRRGINDYVAIHATHGNPNVSFYVSYSTDGLTFNRGSKTPNLYTKDGHISGGQFTNPIKYGNSLGISRLLKDDGTAWFVLVRVDDVYRPTTVFDYLYKQLEIRDFSVYEYGGVTYVYYKTGTVQPDVLQNWNAIKIPYKTLPKYEGVYFDGTGIAKSTVFTELDLAMPIEIHFTPKNVSNVDLISKTHNSNRYWAVRYNNGTFGIYIKSSSVYDYTFNYNLNPGELYVYKAYRDENSNIVQEVNGEIKSIKTGGSSNLPINNPLVVGDGYKGTLSYLKVGDVEFLLNENFGSKADSRKGVSLYFNNSVSWAGCRTNVLDELDPISVSRAGATMNDDFDVSQNKYVLDEDGLSSNDGNKLPTQRSVKKYVDEVAGLVRNTHDVFGSVSKVNQIVTLTEAEKNSIPNPAEDTIYIVPEIQSGFIGSGGGYLSFDGSSTVVARNSSDFDVGTGDFELEIEFRTTHNPVLRVKIIDKRGSSGSSYQISFNRYDWDNTVVSDGNNSILLNGTDYSQNDFNWHNILLKWVNSTGTLEFWIDGVKVNTQVNPVMYGNSISSNHDFTIGGATDGGFLFAGDIRYIRFNSDEILFNEGSGSTLTSENGVVLDINGATWGGSDYTQIWGP